MNQIIVPDFYGGWMKTNSDIIFNQWGIVIAYLFPITLMIGVILLRCADYYELLYRFYPIFILMVVELICLNIHWLLPKGIYNAYFSDRIGNFLVGFYIIFQFVILCRFTQSVLS